MMVIDWQAFGFGVLTGTMGSALFFAGLAQGMRLALRSSSTVAVLLLSATLRIALLLALGALMVPQGKAAIVGFVLSFLIVRFAAIAIARPSNAGASIEQKVSSWN